MCIRDSLPVIRQVAPGVHHVVCILGNIVGLGKILVARHGTRPVHGRILVGPQVHNVIIAFVVGGACLLYTSPERRKPGERCTLSPPEGASAADPE